MLKTLTNLPILTFISGSMRNRCRISGSNQNSGQSVYSYVYDRFGNRWQQNGPHSMQLSFSGSNNRMDGYSYDAAGNLLNDGSHSYTYDAENRITQVDGGSTASYVYGANGQRVQKTTSSGTVNYVYDLSGHQVAEINSSGGWNRGEVYAGSRHLATYNNSTTYFIHPDWLGTERARSSVSGGLCETITSLPFGDGQSTSGSCSDASPMHFTGKERDTESGLDNFGARFDSSNLGRFMSPDPYNSMIIRQGMKVGGLPEEAADNFFNGFLDDPQNWNKYTYALNNPLRFIDPTGAAPQDGHHLIVARDTLFKAGTLARDFTEQIRTGPLSGNGYPNSPGFNELHRAYNDTVKELLNRTVQEEGPAEGWSLQQWKDFANSVLKSQEPAIKEFLDELEENNPGAKAALASSIAAYRVSAPVLARVIAGALVGSLFRTLILCVNCDRPLREEIKIRIVPGPPPA